MPIGKRDETFLAVLLHLAFGTHLKEFARIIKRDYPSAPLWSLVLSLDWSVFPETVHVRKINTGKPEEVGWQDRMKRTHEAGGFEGSDMHIILVAK